MFLIFLMWKTFCTFVLKKLTNSIMQAEITYKTDFPFFFFGDGRFLCVDLEQCKNNQLIEDLIDILDVEACKDEPTIPFEDFVKEENKRRGINV